MLVVSFVIIGTWLFFEFRSPSYGLIAFIEMFSVIFINCFVASIFIWILQNWIRAPKSIGIVSSSLTHGICPCCNYPLNGLTPEKDHCVVCPECNAAWNHARIGSETGS